MTILVSFLWLWEKSRDRRQCKGKGLHLPGYRPSWQRSRGGRAWSSCSQPQSGAESNGSCMHSRPRFRSAFNSLGSPPRSGLAHPPSCPSPSHNNCISQDYPSQIFPEANLNLDSPLQACPEACRLGVKLTNSTDHRSKPRHFFFS